MKRLSFRFCRRALLILAILFPIVYLCGGFFFALAGAHGENVLATEETSIVEKKFVSYKQMLVGNAIYSNNYYLDFSTDDTSNKNYGPGFGTLDMVRGHKYVLLCNDFVLNNANGYWLFNTSGLYQSIPLSTSSSIFTFNNNGSTSFTFVLNGTSDTSLRIIKGFLNLFDLSYMFGLGYEPSLQEFLSYFPNKYYTFGTYEHYELNIFGVPTEQNMLFYHLFGTNNFITDLGKGVLYDTAFGFPPFRDMFNWFNDSVMHIESDDALGVFGLGYAYYALNVVAVYELVVLVLMVFTLPLKITDKFMGDRL